MKAKNLILAGIVLLGSFTSLRAQAPPPAPPAAAGASTAATTATGAATQASGLLGLIQAACGALKACKAKLCACPIGQMISNMTKPINLATGNLLCGTCCPDVDPKKASNTPQGACFKIRQEMAEVPERRAAVRCLAYIDCHWYPEAEAALITALRTDRSECVRLEAAVALGSGCCCTRKTVEALTLVVNGQNTDGNPSENSPRVQQAAYLTLQKCVSAYRDEGEPQRPEKPMAQTTPDGTPVQLASKRAAEEEAKLMDKAVDNARRALAEHQVITTTAGGPRTGQRSLVQMWESSAREPSSAIIVGQPSIEPPAVEQTEPVLMQTGRRSLYQMWVDSFRRPASTSPTTTQSPY